MSFNSIEFIVYFIVVCLVYFAMPKKWRYIWLLIVSYFFYMNWSIRYTVLLLLSTGITYLSGILIGKFREQKNIKAMKWTVAGSFLSNLAILAFFKYGPFILNNVNAVYGVFHGGQHFDYVWRFALPVGISFYTFQALSYTVDVYRAEIPVERNFLRYALFVSFFPQLVAGPIERSKNLLAQVNERPETTKLEYDRIVNGLILMLWGFFMKMVIADRAAVTVDYVWADIPRYSFVELSTAMALFAFQIYCDFAGYSAIAIGAAQVLGFKLMENFQAPLLSSSVKEFWRRWHVSLSTWLKDYVYIPLGGSRCSKIRRYFNLLVTFVVSGIWHGADWSFVLWGTLFGVWLVVEDTVGKQLGDFHRAHHVPIDHPIADALRKLFVFVFFCLTLVFFRAANVGLSLQYFNQMFTHIGVPEGGWHYLSYMGMESKEFFILFVAMMILTVFDSILYFKNMRFDEVVAKMPLLVRWALLIFLFTAIWVMGVYGPEFNSEAFIYFQF